MSHHHRIYGWISKTQQWLDPLGNSEQWDSTNCIVILDPVLNFHIALGAIKQYWGKIIKKNIERYRSEEEAPPLSPILFPFSSCNSQNVVTGCSICFWSKDLKHAHILLAIFLMIKVKMIRGAKMTNVAGKALLGRRTRPVNKPCEPNEQWEWLEYIQILWEAGILF